MSADAQLPEIDKEEDEEENINELYNFLCTAAQSTCEKNTATQCWTPILDTPRKTEVELTVRSTIAIIILVGQAIARKPVDKHNHSYGRWLFSTLHQTANVCKKHPKK